jgi:N-methylhydantoinase A
MVAFGGAGPLHCGALMRETGVSTMLVPLYPGVLCALGCVYADLRYDISQTVEQRLDKLEPRKLADVIARQREQGQLQLDESQVPIDVVTITHAADMAYAGQIHSLRVTIEPDWDAARLEQAFNDVYREKFGNTLVGIPVVIVIMRTNAIGIRSSAALPRSEAVSAAEAMPSARRPVHFNQWYDTPIYQRADLAPGMRFDGPAIIEQSDTTTVVEPTMNVVVDSKGNLLVKVK